MVAPQNFPMRQRIGHLVVLFWILTGQLRICGESSILRRSD